MRLATWNVNGLRARMDYFVEWLEARKPDVVGLQELKMTDDKFPHEALAGLGYRAVTHGQKAWNGVAVVTREEASVTCVGLPGMEDAGSRLISVEVGDLSFTTVYCPNGKSVTHDDYPRKLAWFDALADHLERVHRPDSPMVLCGDFNVCPTGLDSWNEETFAGSIFHTDDERSRLRRLMDWGLRDTFRELHPDAQTFSWWDYRGGSFHRGHGLRIDFLLGTDPVIGRLRSAEVDREFRKKREGLTPSDHAPVMIDLD